MPASRLWEARRQRKNDAGQSVGYRFHDLIRASAGVGRFGVCCAQASSGIRAVRSLHRSAAMPDWIQPRAWAKTGSGMACIKPRT